VIFRHDLRSGLTTNTLASFGISALTRGSSFALMLVIARHLSIETFGQYVLALSVAEVLRGLTDFGVDQTLVRGLARRSAPEIAVASAVLIKIIAGCITIIGIAGIGRLAIDTDTIQYVQLAYIAATIGAVSRTLTAPAQSELRTLRMLPAAIAGMVCRATALGGAILAGMDLRGVLTTTLIAEMVALAITYVTLSRLGPAHLLPGLRRLWPLLREAAPLGALSVLVLLYFRIDTILLSLLAGQSAVAEYGAVYRISEALMIVATAIASTTLPTLSAGFRRSRDAASHTYQQCLRISTAITATAVGIGLVAPDTVMSLLYGEKYRDTGLFLTLMLLSAVVMAINVIQASALIALDGQSLIAKVAVVNLVVNVGLNVLLIPTFGVLGACISTLVTESINSIVQFTLLSRHVGFAGTPRLVSGVAGSLLVGAGAAQVVHSSVLWGGVAILLILVIGVASASPRSTMSWGRTMWRSAPLSSGA
jgi:O-antigen/teichoic acid export membrane protein